MATILKFPKPAYAANKEETPAQQKEPAQSTIKEATSVEEGVDFGTLSHSELGKACAIRQRVRDAISSLNPEEQFILTSAMYELAGDPQDLGGYFPAAQDNRAEYLDQIITGTDTPLSRLAVDPNSEEFAGALRSLRQLKSKKE